MHARYASLRRAHTSFIRYIDSACPTSAAAPISPASPPSAAGCTVTSPCERQPRVLLQVLAQRDEEQVARTPATPPPTTAVSISSKVATAGDPRRRGPWAARSKAARAALSPAAAAFLGDGRGREASVPVGVQPFPHGACRAMAGPAGDDLHAAARAAGKEVAVQVDT